MTTFPIRKLVTGMVLAALACSLYVVPSMALAQEEPKPTHVRVQVDGYSQDTALLGYYMDGKTYIYDTLLRAQDDYFVIKHDTAIQGGIYLFVLKPQNNYFEILLNGATDQFTLHTDSANFITNMKVKGSRENKLFYEFQKYAIEKEKEIGPIRAEYDSLSKDTTGQVDQDYVEELREKLIAFDREVKAYRKRIAEENPGTFLGTLYSLISEPELPEELQNAQDDSTRKAALYWYRQNYFNGVNLSDPSLLRTPVLKPKLNDYLERMVPPVPDTAIAQADYLIDLASDNYLTRRYMISTVFNHYVNSKVMGMDAVYVHLAENYYMNGKADWAGEEFLKQLEDNIPVLKTLLIGKPAPQLAMSDENQQMQFLLQQPYDYTIAFFYDPTCGHCQKSTRKLRKVIDNLADQSIGVYAVCTKPEKEKWLEFIEEYNIGDWTNVCDLYNTTGFRDVYNIKSTPKTFLIGPDNTIVAKDLEPMQVEDIVRHKLGLEPRDKTAEQGAGQGAARDGGAAH